MVRRPILSATLSRQLLHSQQRARSSSSACSKQLGCTYASHQTEERQSSLSTSHSKLLVLQEDIKKGWYRCCSGSALGLSQWVAQAALGTGQGHALAHGYAEGDWDLSYLKKKLNGKAKMTKRRGREIETATQICKITVLDNENWRAECWLHLFQETAVFI